MLFSWPAELWIPAESFDSAEEENWAVSRGPQTALPDTWKSTILCKDLAPDQRHCRDQEISLILKHADGSHFQRSGPKNSFGGASRLEVFNGLLTLSLVVSYIFQCILTRQVSPQFPQITRLPPRDISVKTTHHVLSSFDFLEHLLGEYCEGGY